MNKYEKGNVIRLSAIFTCGGTPVDPTSITCKVWTPAGTPTTYTYGGVPPLNTIVKDGVGQYHLDFTITLEGGHHYAFYGTGDCVAAMEADFYVFYSAF